VSVEVLLPGVLADLAGGQRRLEVDPVPATVAGLLDALAGRHPVLERRIRDEAGALRRFVNVYVDGDDVRFAAGVDTAVPDGAVVHVLPSVAGG
jgi:molybdopterin converting factor small subunit